RDLLEFLSAPAVRGEDKVTAAANILEAVGVGPTVTRFFSLLIRHHRVGVLPQILDEFSTVASDLTGECFALVETARPLTEEQQGRLERVLASALGGIVRVRQRVVPGLLAGARIRIGDRTIDGSVLGRLENLRARLVYGPLAGDEPAQDQCARQTTGGQR
ncbi:MAG: ATP synthase F1 subunit delta, partial [Planctomycetes bacterium]|nr:ATP synthase F1 subunit delta [Planctomycetota bacterium]